MTRNYKKLFDGILSFALSVWLTIAGIFPAIPPITVKADSCLAYEQTNVMDDLKATTISGKQFSLLEYGFNPFKDTQVLSLVEYCYSFYLDKQDNYGLYVYVYNPKGLDIDVQHSLNSIQLSIGDIANGNYQKYGLQFLNCSIETNYERLFYKFKIVLSDAEKQEILQAINSSERVYRVSGIELMETGKTQATEFWVGTTYRYNGYAKGYGAEETAGNTLTCNSEQAEVLSLNVRPTVYRPNGSNGKSEWHQDSLHSVYFSVPNDTLKRYGYMSSVHATWLNAVLAPSLVTGNYDAYSGISPYLGKELPTTDKGYHTNDLYFMYYGACTGVGAGFSNATCYYGYSYNAMSGWSGHTMIRKYYGKATNPLYAMYYAGNGADSADKYIVSTKQILSALKESKSKYGGELVNGKYSKYMFESVDEQFTIVHIQADESYSLTEQKIDKAWWNGLFGVDRPDIVTTTVFDNIPAIYAVKDGDLVGTEEEVAKRLYISTADYKEFTEYYNANKDLCTVYLFRYQTSDYIAQEATLYQYYPNGSIFTTGVGWQKCDTNGYFFQQTVNLDFDVIDVTFSNGNVNTVMPIISNPIDVVHDATPPLDTHSDALPEWLRWLKIGLGLMIVVVIVVVCSPVLRWIGKIIGAPFRLISAWRRNRKEENWQEKDIDEKDW